MAASQVWIAAESSRAGTAAAPLVLTAFDIRYGHQLKRQKETDKKQQQEEEEEEEEEEECFITRIVHGSDALVPWFAPEAEANSSSLLRQDCKQEEKEKEKEMEEDKEGVGFPQTSLVLLQDLTENNAGVVVVEEEKKSVSFPQTFFLLQDAKEKKTKNAAVMEEAEAEEEACVYMVVDYGLQEVEDSGEHSDRVRFPPAEEEKLQMQEYYSCEDEQEEMAGVILGQEGRWLLQRPKKNGGGGGGGAQFEEIADLKPFLQAYMAANSVGLYSSAVEQEEEEAEEDVLLHNAQPQQQQQQKINNNAHHAVQEAQTSAMEIEEEDVKNNSCAQQLLMIRADGNAIVLEDEETEQQQEEEEEGDSNNAAAAWEEAQEQEVGMAVVEQQQVSTSLSMFHSIVGTTLALQENSQQIALSVTPLSTRPPPCSSSATTGLELAEVSKELAFRTPPEHPPCLLTPFAMFTGWENVGRIGYSHPQPLKQITDGSSHGGGGGKDYYEWGHFDASDWVPFSSKQAKNSPPLLAGKKGSPVPMPYHCKPLKTRTPTMRFGKDNLSHCGGEQSEDAARQNVIQALYKFEELRQSFIEVEEARAAKGKAEGQAVRLRPDLKASVQMRIDGLRVNTNPIIGSVPGVHVGDHFWYRIEMVIVGLHQQLEAGIAFIGKSKSSSGISLATSIVIKHGGNPYLDDEENGDIITYTGQGGLSHRSPNAHSVTDQVLTRGNEALKNSFEHSQPIRVIRGHKDKKSPTTESYTYLGLYKALAMRYEPGVGGNRVYKFDLQRLEGQSALPAPSESLHESASIKAGPSSSFKGKNASPSFKGKGAHLQNGGGSGGGESSKYMSPKGKS